MIAKLTEVAKERSKDIYDDGLKPATREAGEAFQAIVGLFNNVVLYPVKKANITFKYKLERFEQDLKIELDKIPDEKLIEPPLTIAGPTLEALKYTFDTKELREMYINLLATSMNVDTVRFSHPAYVDIIKQMSKLDAIVFQVIAKIVQIPCANIRFTFGTKMYSDAMPEIFIPHLLDTEDPFLISLIVQNLCRSGVITYSDSIITGYDYDSFKDHEFVKSRFERYKGINSKEETKIAISKQTVFLSDLGKNFAKACL